MLRCIASGLLGLVSLLFVAAHSNAAEELSGSLLTLSDNTKNLRVNVGGLVAVVIRDSGSRPPQDVKVDYPRAYKKLGVVQGAQADDGTFAPGGGYTWYLLTPVTAGETSITVSYTENGDEGKKVSRSYKVQVEK